MTRLDAAERCECCGRMRYDVRRVELLVEAATRVDVRLCRPCVADTVERVLLGLLQVSAR